MAEQNTTSTAGSIMLAMVIVAVSVTAAVIASFYVDRYVYPDRQEPPKLSYVYINEQAVYHRGGEWAAESGDINIAQMIAKDVWEAIYDVSKEYEKKDFLVFFSRALIIKDPSRDVTNEAIDALEARIKEKTSLLPPVKKNEAGTDE